MLSVADYWVFGLERYKSFVAIIMLYLRGNRWRITISSPQFIWEVVIETVPVFFFFLIHFCGLSKKGDIIQAMSLDRDELLNYACSFSSNMGFCLRGSLM